MNATEAMGMSDPSASAATQLAALERLYVENAETYRHFLEWRHKILLRYFFILTAAAIVTKEVIDYGPKLPFWVALVPPLIVCAGAITSYGMDCRNAWVLTNAVTIGSELEALMMRTAGIQSSQLPTGPFYSRFTSRAMTRFTYSRILQLVYVGTCLLALATTVLILLNQPHASQTGGANAAADCTKRARPSTLPSP